MSSDDFNNRMIQTKSSEPRLLVDKFDYAKAREAR